MRDLNFWFRQEVWSEAVAACLLCGLNPDKLSEPVPLSVIDAADQMRRAFVVGELSGWTDETQADSARLFNQGSDGELLEAIGRARFYRSEDVTAWAGRNQFPEFRKPDASGNDKAKSAAGG